VSYEQYKKVEEQMRAFKETQHKTTGGFYHKSIRMPIDDGLILEIHGPLVGGYGHRDEEINAPLRTLGPSIYFNPLTDPLPRNEPSEWEPPSDDDLKGF